METQLGPLRQGIQTAVGRALPPPLSLPLRARFGGSREPELAILSRFVHPGDTVIDVGAHHGVYTYHLARLVGPTGHVLAYEPQPELVQYLSAAATGRTLRHRTQVRAKALSDAAGTTVLHIPIADGQEIIGRASLQDVGAGALEYEVALAVLDDEPLPGPVRFMKIDVEGHELVLLRGARTVIARDRPTLLIEVEIEHAGIDHVQQLASLLLDDLGYRALELSGDRLVPVERARWSGTQLNRRADGQYTNNFVFTDG